MLLNYDAICNAGVGVAHDSSATNWVNLGSGGSRYDLYLSATNRPTYWSEDGFWFDGKQAFACNATLTLPSALTVQTLVDAHYHDQPVSGMGYVFFPCGADSENRNNWQKLSLVVRGRTVGDPIRMRLNSSVFGAGNPDYIGVRFTYATAMYNETYATLFEGIAPPSSGSKYKSGKTITEFAFPSRWGIGGNPNAAGGNASQGLTGTVRNFRVYTRALTNAELAWNRMVDDARYFGKPGVAHGNVAVTANVRGLSGAEPNGCYAVDAAGHEFTAPATAETGGAVYALAGYEIEAWSDETGWGAPERHAGESSYSATSAGKVRLTWLYAPSRPEGASTADYVQDGLLLFYDGIENAGRGLPHDSSASTWVNIASNGVYDLALDRRPDYPRDLPHCHWESDGYRFSGVTMFRHYDTYNPLRLPPRYTMEILVAGGSGDQCQRFEYLYTNDLYQTTAEDPDNRANNGEPTIAYIFDNYGAYNAGSIAMRRDSKAHPVNFVCDLLNGATSATRPGFTRSYNDYTTNGGIAQGVAYDYITAVLDGDVAMAFPGTTKPTAAVGGGYPAWGWYSGTSKGGASVDNYCIGGRWGQPFRGVVKSLRLYTRVLSDAELAQNRAVDDARHFGRTSSTNALIASQYPFLSGTEPNGAYSVGASGHVFTAPSNAVDHAGAKWRCSGHRLQAWTGSGWGAATESSSRERAVSASQKVKVTWLWEAVEGLKSAADYDVVDYVQDGLVLHYDGIRNVGAEAAHCTNSVWWNNLAGRGFDMRRMRYGTLTTGMYAYSDGSEAAGRWADDGFEFDGLSYFVSRERFEFPASPRFTIQVKGEFNGQEQTGSSGVGYLFLPCLGGASSGWTAGSVAVRAKDLSTTGDEPCGYMVTDFFGVNYSKRPTVQAATLSYFTGVADGTRFAATDGTTLSGLVWATGSGAAKDCFGYHMTVGGFHSAGNIGGRQAQCVLGRLQNLRWYARVLSDEELAWNRAVDEARFAGKVPRADVVVAAPTYAADGQSEAAGEYEVVGFWTFTARDTTNEKGRLRRLVGYTLETWDESSGEWRQRHNFAGSAYTHVVGASPSRVRLTWRWQLEPTVMLFR